MRLYRPEGPGPFPVLMCFHGGLAFGDLDTHAPLCRPLCHETGCLVKDLDKGLVDFPTLFRGEEVYLCWKMDEPAIQFWHSVEEGFSGRKQIDQEFRDNHRGDALT